MRNFPVLVVLFVASAAASAAQVNVFFRDGTASVEHDRALLRAGASKLGDLAAANVVSARVAGAASWRALAAEKTVVLVEEDSLIWAISTNDDVATEAASRKVAPRSSTQVVPTGVQRIGASPPSTTTGQGVTVAIVDTGIDLSHPDLSANINVANSRNIINSRKSAQDDNGHGTHVAGTVAAINNTIGVVGVAPNAKLLAIKVLDRNGSGTMSQVGDGVRWAADHGAKVINMSLGAATGTQYLYDAITYAAGKKVVIVCAAGNSGPNDNTVIYPAKYTECVAVSAWVDTNGVALPLGPGSSSGPDESLASFSSRGPEIDVTAPGVNILSTYPGGKYATGSGTSMASPHAAGCVARLISSGSTDPRADLSAGAEPVNGTANEVGSGLVHAVP